LLRRLHRGQPRCRRLRGAATASASFLSIFLWVERNGSQSKKKIR
jgi:hypothetical protein